MTDEIKNAFDVEVNPEAKTEEAVEPVKPKPGASRKKKAEAALATLEVSNSVYDQILEETRITNSLLRDLVGSIVKTNEYNDKAFNLLNEQIEKQRPIVEYQLKSLNVNTDNDLVTKVNKSFDKVHSDIESIVNQLNKTIDKMYSNIDRIDERLAENEKLFATFTTGMLLGGVPVKVKKKKKNKNKH